MDGVPNITMGVNGGLAGWKRAHSVRVPDITMVENGFIRQKQTSSALIFFGTGDNCLNVMQAIFYLSERFYKDVSQICELQIIFNLFDISFFGYHLRD